MILPRSSASVDPRAVDQVGRFQPVSPSEIASMAKPKQAPGLFKFALETRAAFDAVKLPLTLSKSFITTPLRRQRTAADEKPVVVMFPGYGTDEKVFIPLRQHLINLGYDVACWGMGKNLAGDDLPHSPEDLPNSWVNTSDGLDLPTDYAGEGRVAYLTELASQELQKIVEKHRRPVVLLGWSLGGYIAREVARENPEKVRHVITMGSPIVGGARFTVFGSRYKDQGVNVDWIEKKIEAKHQEKMPVNVTAIFSKSDGLVDWRSMIDKVNIDAVHWEVSCSHCGMPFNQSCWDIVEHTLAKHSH